MSDMTPETIEAAARAIYDVRDDPYDDDEWDEMDSSDREEFMCQARAALSAAYPLMVARVKAEALERLAVSFEATASCASYIGTEDIMETWLNAAQRARAAAKDVSP